MVLKASNTNLLLGTVATVDVINKFMFRYKKQSLNDSNIIVNEAKYFNDS